MTHASHNKRLGLSLVELLVTMAILGILLAMLSAFLMGNQRVTSQQITAATLNNDLRLSFLRISEIISQAHYIFPPNQNISVNGTTYTTGARALVVLVPANTTYCPDTNGYCGFAFTIEARAPFTTDFLGANTGTTNFALIETRERGLTWSQNKIPALESSLTTWVTTERSPITDSVDAAQSDLASFKRLEPSKDTNFDKGFKVNVTEAATGDYDVYLAASVNSKVRLERRISGQTLSIEQENFVFSRAIPRGSNN
jgi:prepilin-type N-terminal cleavage/methylation domain-containing protein